MSETPPTNLPAPTSPGLTGGVPTAPGPGNTSGAGPTLTQPADTAPTPGPVHPKKPGDDTTATPVNEWMQDA